MSSKVTMIHNNEIVSDITFKNVADNYVEEQQLTLRPNSINKYVFLLDKHILPELGDVPFQQINHEQIKLFLDRKSSDGRLEHSGGLSGNTLNDILVLIKSIIIYGENKYNLHINLGKFQFKKNMQLTERFYTKEDIKTLLEQAWKEYSADSKDLRCLGVLLCMYTGLRIGELCALRWEDINIKSGILYVRNSMHRLVNNETDKKTQLVIASPKTQNSTRMIPIKSNILKILSEIQTQYIETDFLLSGKSDKLIEPRNLQYYFKKLQLRAGIEPLCFHSLRHTFASICIQLGDILVVLLANNVTVKSDWIDDCVKMMQENMSISAVVPVYEDNDHHPLRGKRVDENGKLQMYEQGIKGKISTNRQDLPKCYFLSHNFWVINTKLMLENKYEDQQPWGFLGNNIAYYEIEESIDIHKNIDLYIAREWIKDNYTD